MNKELFKGEWIGLTDKNGEKIHEGMQVKLGESILTVFYQAPSFVMKKNKRAKTWHEFILAPSEDQFCEIIKKY